MAWFESKTKNIPDSEIENYDVGRIDHSKNYRLDNIAIQHCSENTKERNERLGNPMPSKKVRVFNKTIGEERIFDSILAAANFYGMTDSSVAYRCEKKKFRLKKHKDLEFSYLNG